MNTKKIVATLFDTVFIFHLIAINCLTIQMYTKYIRKNPRLYFYAKLMGVID